MGTIIKEIKIPDENYSFISDNGEKGDVLKNLAKINIFVGENNSGKSRFLRSIVAEKYFEFIPNNENFFEVIKGIKCLKGNLSNSLRSPMVLTDLTDLKKSLDEIEIIEFLKPNSGVISDLTKINLSLEALTQNYPSSEIKDINYDSNDVVNLLNVFNTCFKDLKNPITDLNLDYGFSKIYIPILRGLRLINYGTNTPDFKRRSIALPNDNDVYKIRTIADYFDSIFNDEDNYEFEEEIVFTGLNAYGRIKKHILSRNEEDWEIIEEFETYLSEKFFGNEPVKIRPADGEEKDVIVKIGAERGKPIYELGDGIQSIIIITLPLFLKKDKIKDNENVLVFIEEPEHLLHPSLQRKLIETFNDERFKGFQFFFTTHSNHFLDISLDFEGISMFTVRKYLEDANNPKFLVKNVNFGDNNLLNLLGIRSSSVFLPNCNIWVEGPTDTFYLRRFFNIYQDHMKKENKNFRKFDEDRHYSFYVYNGSDITNLIDLSLNNNDRRLNRLLVIRDGDTEYEEDKKAHNDELKDKLGDKFELINCWEIENLLSESVILETLENDKRYRNIPLNKDIEYKNYQNKDLGDYIRTEIFGNQINWNPIKKKTKFYKKVEGNIQKFTDLSPESLKVCERIYNFIKENNS